jgi:hypothetical protein
MSNINVEVELEPGFQNYRLLPTPLSPEQAVEAIRQSWRFLLVAPRRITAPLLASAYAAPLSEIVVPDFTIWLWGGTGSFKSTLAALILSHYGDFSETNLPLSFESTSNALERNLFLAKDVLTVVDDWRHARRRRGYGQEGSEAPQGRGQPSGKRPHDRGHHPPPILSSSWVRDGDG